MTKSNGHKKIKPNDHVMFCHVAAGNKPMSGVVVEVRREKNIDIYLIQDHKQRRFYPGVGDSKFGRILHKIKK